MNIQERASGLIAINHTLAVPNAKVELYDTTLRDGQQRRDVGYSPLGKLRVARQINKTLPVSLIEGGWPGANPTDTEFFQRAKDEPFHYKLAAFGMTRRAGSYVESDATINNLLDSGAPVITLVGKSDTLHVEKVFKTTHEENLAMIEDSVRYMREQGKRVIYDAEHFFDGVNRDPEYAMETLYAAARGGAETIVLCDTNGGKMPWDIEEQVKKVLNDSKLHQLYRAAYDISDPTVKMQVGIHTHADRSMAEANALYAVRAGVTHVQGTVAGLGERAGNANILVVADELDNQGLLTLTPEQRAGFVELGNTIYEASGATVNPHSPLIGEHVFGTTAGMHQDATLKEPDAYTHRKPQDYGNELKIFINNQSGKRAVAERASQLGLTISSDAITDIINEIKDKERQGYRFTRAEASLALLMRKYDQSYQEPFQLHTNEEGMFIALPSENGDALSLDRRPLSLESQGISGVFDAIKTALKPIYPQINDCSFDRDRIERENGTVRVFIKIAHADNTTWTTNGVGQTIQEATLIAAADALKYGIIYAHTQDPQVS